jgi:DNA-directed RNA polymerase subunit L
MDNEIKMFDLSSNEYIKLNKSGYTIINKDSTIDSTTENEDNTILNKLNRALKKIINIDEDDYEMFEDELMK